MVKELVSGLPYCRGKSAQASFPGDETGDVDIAVVEAEEDAERRSFHECPPVANLGLFTSGRC
jgi:hypothetical protein